MGALERLLARVDRLPIMENGCRMWDGAVDKDGYGVTTLRENGRRIKGTQRVHRRVLAGQLGRALGTREQACHTCDTPGCVEATHLWVGSARDNRNDAMSKGRIDLESLRHRLDGAPRVYGDQHGRRKLHSTEVVVILQLLAAGELYRVIGDRFGVSIGTITNIATGKNWKCVPRPADLHERRALVKQAQAPDWHGTLSGYRHRGCRCGPCTAATSDRHRAWVESKRAA